MRWQGRPWRKAAGLVGRAVLPGKPRNAGGPRRVPRFLAHVFWNEDVGRLDLDRDGGRRVEEGIALALRKYRPRGEAGFAVEVVRALSFLEDLEEDPALPMTRAEIEAYWSRRIPDIVRSLGTRS